jgi:hypothetical protein
MRKSILRFSIRRGIKVVAAFALVLGCGVATRDWYQARKRLFSADHAYSRSCVLYEDGRATCIEVALRSRCVMDAELELLGSSRERSLAVVRHVRRLQSLRDEEALMMETELDCHGVGRTMLAELDGVLIEARALLASR